MHSRKYIGNRNCIILNNNKFYSTNRAAQPAIPFLSLRDIVNYKTEIIKTNPYLGLLKGTEDSKF